MYPQFQEIPRIVLIACGSFSPPTVMHLRIFEIARDHIEMTGGGKVIGGIISPVHDSYGKKGLAPATHRLAMLKLSLKSSNWIKLSDWECNQSQWTRTRQTLQYHQNYMNNLLNEINDFNPNTPGWLPDNLRERNDPVKLKLLCGADLLESFSVPGLWSEEDIEDIVGNFGMVVISRGDSNPEKIIFDSDILTKYQTNITIVRNWIPNEVSSSMIRRLLKRGQSVKYLIDDLVITYIQAHGLYDVKILFYGVYEIRNPILSIRDPDLIKQITVKDFDHFVNHRVLLEPQDEPLFGNSLFSLKDQKWKAMRATLSPSFTGSKMRIMFQLIEECSQSALKHLKDKVGVGKPIELDMKEFFTRYTNDVVASTAFGLKINSLEEKDNEFYKMGRKATNFSGWVAIKFFLFSNFRQLMRLLRVKLFDDKFTNYFFKLVIDAMKYRQEHGIVRPDMIQLLMETRKNKTNDDDKFGDWTDEDIVAQCFLFFIAGFETTATLMCFVAHELMENHDVQDKLLQEIDEMKEQLGDKPLTYDVVQKMKYLDMVVSETLRKWPPVVASDRVCSKPYQIYDEKTGNKVQIDVGDVIWVPIAGLHYDPQYFPDPKRFDPERFNDENKSKINQFAYLPFGVGPRSCIGNRFALMETKAILVQILMQFTFEASPKSSIPLKLSASGFQLIPKGGFWLKLVPR